MRSGFVKPFEKWSISPKILYNKMIITTILQCLRFEVTTFQCKPNASPLSSLYSNIYYLSPLHCNFMSWCFMSWWDIIHPIKRVHEFNYLTYKGITLWLTFVSSLYIVLQSKRTCDNMTMITSYVNHQSVYFGIHLQWEPTCS